MSRAGSLWAFIKKHHVALLFFAVAALGAFFRFYHLNWDEGYFYHSDERNVTAAIMNLSIPSQLDPKFYAYNAFPFYVVRMAAQVPALVFRSRAFTTDWAAVNLVGRYFSAAYSTASLVAMYFLAKRLLRSQYAALLAMAFLAFSPGFIQYAHYNLTESLLVLELLSIAWLSLVILERPTTARWIWLGVLCGLSLATKTTAASFLIIPLGTWLLLLWKRKDFPQLWLEGCIFVAATVAVTFLGTPYSFINSQGFLTSMHYENGVATGSLPVPYTVQFDHTAAYWFQFKNFSWQLGPVLPWLGAIGLVAWCWYALRHRRYEALPLLLFSLAYLAYVGSWHAKFVRYMLPFLPVLLLAAAWLCQWLWENTALQNTVWQNTVLQNRKTKVLGVALAAATVTLAVAWSFAYISVFVPPTTRTVASQWVVQHAPAGSTLITEQYDDTQLPVQLHGVAVPQYANVVLPSYDPDTAAKVQILAKDTSAGYYVILESHRVSGSIEADAAQYPITSRYYRELLGGQLGYTLVKTFTGYPHIGAFKIDDDSSEDSFQEYEHPTVKIYQNTGHFSESRILALLYGGK